MKKISFTKILVLLMAVSFVGLSACADGGKRSMMMGDGMMSGSSRK